MYVHRFFSPAVALSILACALSLLACGARQTASEGGAAALARNLAQVRILELHVDEDALVDPARRLAAREHARSGREVRVLQREDGDRHAARIFLGTARSDRAVTLAFRGGVVVRSSASGASEDRTGFHAADLQFGGADDVARATFEDPERPGLPITLWLGNDGASLARQVESVAPTATPCLAVWRAGDLVLTSPLWADGELDGRRIERVGFSRLALRGPLDVLADGDGFVVQGAAGLVPTLVDGVLRDLRSARERAASWCGATLPKIDVRLLFDVEDLRLAGEEASLGRWNRARPSADMLFVAGVSDGGAAAMRAGLRGALGPAADAWIEEAASVSASETWWGRDLDRWLARLVNASCIPRVAELVAPNVEARISTHVLAPARAALFDHLRSARGDAFVRELWNGTAVLGVDEALEQGFASAVRARAASFLPALSESDGARRAEVLGRPPVAGVVYTASGHDPRSGYGSRAASEGLRELRQHGARSIAIPAQFRDSQFGEPLDAATALQPTTGDVAVFGAAAAAHGAGLHVAILPDLVTSEAGSALGGWARNGADDWAEYFERHARVVEHAGFLATLCDADWLSVGSALPAITNPEPAGRRASPEERTWKQAGWQRLIGAARGAFPGGLTYGAVDVAEAERIGFWGELDAVGIELNSSVVPDGPDSALALDRDLRAFLEGSSRVAARERRPLLLTRVSLASARGSEPGRVLDGIVAQLRSLESAGKWATSKGALEVRSLWLDRVGTDPEDRGINARDHVLLRRWWPELEPFFRAVPEWVREESRAEGRSPR